MTKQTAEGQPVQLIDIEEYHSSNLSREPTERRLEGSRAETEH